MSVLLTILLALSIAVGPPTSPPPEVGGIGVAPPPAWIENGTRSRWLAYGSYCWKTACVDMLPPESASGLPQIKVPRGQMLRVHLAFTPKRVAVRVLRGGRSITLPSTEGRTLAFRARRGILIVDVGAARGSASYIARLG